MKFTDLHLIAPILKAVQAEGYETPTPIQQQAIPRILERKDLLACAQTGTGKTAAFALPILQLLAQHDMHAIHKSPVKEIRVLVLTPTRELASQISESFTNYGKGLGLNNTVIFGGVGQNPQAAAVRRGVDVVIATPGRLLDLIQQRLVRFNTLEIFVLDEADRMLDMGFIHDVRKIISVIPKRRQTLFFSATMPPEISKLAAQILTSPVRIEVTPVATTAELIQQSVYHVPMNLKTSLLKNLLGDPEVKRALVFTRTKRDANRVAETLSGAGIGAAAIHGNKSQGARERALESIKTGDLRVLVATDIAARGIDIDQVTHVFNYDIPNVPESYVHRIGRTARAGKKGLAISFCAPEEKSFLSDIERLIRKRPVVIETPVDLLVEKKGGGDRGRRGNNQRPNRKSGGSGSEGHGFRSRGPVAPRAALGLGTSETRGTSRPAHPASGQSGQRSGFQGLTRAERNEAGHGSNQGPRRNETIPRRGDVGTSSPRPPSPNGPRASGHPPKPAGNHPPRGNRR